MYQALMGSPKVALSPSPPSPPFPVSYEITATEVVIVWQVLPSIHFLWVRLRATVAPLHSHLLYLIASVTRWIKWLTVPTLQTSTTATNPLTTQNSSILPINRSNHLTPFGLPSIKTDHPCPR